MTNRVSRTTIDEKEFNDAPAFFEAQGFNAQGDIVWLLRVDTLAEAEAYVAFRGDPEPTTEIEAV